MILIALTYIKAQEQLIGIWKTLEDNTRIKILKENNIVIVRLISTDKFDAI